MENYFHQLKVGAIVVYFALNQLENKEKEEEEKEEEEEDFYCSPVTIFHKPFQ